MARSLKEVLEQQNSPYSVSFANWVKMTTKAQAEKIIELLKASG